LTTAKKVIKRFKLKIHEHSDGSFYFLAKLSKSFGERPGKKGERETPEEDEVKISPSHNFIL
jgi:hypothetical protein